MSTVTRHSVLSAYKNLLKAQRNTFKADVLAIKAARQRTYHEFIKYRDEKDPDTIQEKLAYANQITSILTKNIVQGVRKTEENIYSLQFNPDTELGDNNSINKAKSGQRKDKAA